MSNCFMVVCCVLKNTISCADKMNSMYVTLQGHSSFITHLDWSKDGKYIMSNSGDYEILYCKAARLSLWHRNIFQEDNN